MWAEKLRKTTLIKSEKEENGNKVLLRNRVERNRKRNHNESSVAIISKDLGYCYVEYMCLFTLGMFLMTNLLVDYMGGKNSD